MIADCGASRCHLAARTVVRLRLCAGACVLVATFWRVALAGARCFCGNRQKEAAASWRSVCACLLTGLLLLVARCESPPSNIHSGISGS